MSLHHRIHETVRRIPSGRVATYGQVAAAAGLPGRALYVGFALAALPEGTDVPWHRVVNTRGGISPRAGGGASEKIQRILLESEGVVFDHDWKPLQLRTEPGKDGTGLFLRRATPDGQTVAYAELRRVVRELRAGVEAEGLPPAGPADDGGGSGAP